MDLGFWNWIVEVTYSLKITISRRVRWMFALEGKYLFSVLSQNNYLTQGEMDNTKGLRKRFDNRSQNNYLTQGEMDRVLL